MSIDIMTPKEADKGVGEIEKRWISYRSIAIKGRLDRLEDAEKDISSIFLSVLYLRATTSGQPLTGKRLAMATKLRDNKLKSTNISDIYKPSKLVEGIRHTSSQFKSGNYNQAINKKRPTFSVGLFGMNFSKIFSSLLADHLPEQHRVRPR
ncbi:MAG: hypothetical protein ACRCTF_03450 [Bacteroidales bacterium]